jgi:hypothetical protein
MMLRRLADVFRRRRLDAELDAEMRHHIESLEAEHRGRGLSAEAARLAAQRDMGGIMQTKEAYRDEAGVPMLETLWRDVRFGLRTIRRTPTVSAAVVATLAIGIGANTAMFTVVNSVSCESSNGRSGRSIRIFRWRRSGPSTTSIASHSRGRRSRLRCWRSPA